MVGIRGRLARLTPFRETDYDLRHDGNGATRSRLRQTDPQTGDGRRPGRELGSPGDAHGDGARGLLPLEPLPALRSRRSDLAQPGPLRPLDGPCVDAPLLA